MENLNIQFNVMAIVLGVTNSVRSKKNIEDTTHFKRKQMAKSVMSSKSKKRTNPNRTLVYSTARKRGMTWDVKIYRWPDNTTP